MNEPLDCWASMIFVLIWRLLMNKTRTKRLDSLLRSCGLCTHGFTPVFQWYFLAAVLISMGLLGAFKDIVLYDYFKMHFLRKYTVSTELTLRENKAILLPALPEWLRLLALVAPIVGVIAFVIMLLHVRRYSRKRMEEKVNRRKQKQEGSMIFEVGAKVREVDGLRRAGIINVVNKGHTEFGIRFMTSTEERGTASEQCWKHKDDIEFIVDDHNPWRMNRVEDFTLLVIFMPGVHIVMAMWAEIRALQLMTGSSLGTDDWDDFKLWRQSTYVQDVGCAYTFQYLTVWSFASLCASFFTLDPLPLMVESRESKLMSENNRLRCLLHMKGKKEESLLGDYMIKANTDHESTLYWVGLQGVWAYIMVGVVRSFTSLATVILSLLDYKDMSKLLNACDPYVQPLFLFTTLLCIFNMMIILRLEEIKDPTALGQFAPLKFWALRFLILVGDGQKQALYVIGSLTFNKFSWEMAELTHVTLLVFESLFVVIWNCFMWRAKIITTKERRFESDYRRLSSFVSDESDVQEPMKKGEEQYLTSGEQWLPLGGQGSDAVIETQACLGTAHVGRATKPPSCGCAVQ